MTFDLHAGPSKADEDLAKAVYAMGGRLEAARAAVESVIFGQDDVVELSLVTLLSGGHVLLIGVPGLAKTRLVETLGTVLGLDNRRIQCTPDLMPADILGSEILEKDEDGRGHFRFKKGPVFCQLLMADEINRASPRTQSALLQAMQEHRVTIAGRDHVLPAPFHVLATQNPIEHEGTYLLPEAQLDRFMMQIDIGHPDRAAERKMLLSTTGADNARVLPVLSAPDLIEAQTMVRRMPVGEMVLDAILTLVRNGRPEQTDIDLVRDVVVWGPGPRASQALMLAVRARALVNGRLAPSIDDVVALAKPVLQHRMALTYTAQADKVSLDSVISCLCEPLR